MTLPKFHETFIPILEILSNGQIIHYNELLDQVLNKYYNHLPEELRERRLRSGSLTLISRIGWGKSYLKLGKFIDYPARGLVQITPKGLEILSKGFLTFEQFKKDPDYIAYRKSNQKQKETEESSLDNTPEELIAAGISDIESQVKAELLEKIKSVNPYYFEKIILILLKRMGYGEFVETPKSHDGGIDGIMNQDRLGFEKIYVQVKRYGDSKVREKEIRNFIGAMSGETSKGVFVTTSMFDNSAVAKAVSARHVISLIDGKKLVELMFEHNVGIQIRQTYEIKEIDQDFFEGS